MESYLMLMFIYFIQCNAVEECFKCSASNELTCAQIQTLQLCHDNNNNNNNNQDGRASCMAISYKERKDGRKIDRFVKGCTKSYDECMSQCKHAQFMKRSNCQVACCNTERCNYAENPEKYGNRKKRYSGGDDAEQEKSSSQSVRTNVHYVVVMTIFVLLFMTV